MTATPDTTGKPEARVIKFRAWNGDAMSDPFCPWELIREETGGLITPGGVSVWWPKENGPQSFVWYQFTGLFDRNGKEIYEGDIVKIPDDWDTFGFMAGEKRQIILKDGGFRFAPKEGHKGRGHWLEDVAGLEVIGNIMQNPELLKP